MVTHDEFAAIRDKLAQVGFPAGKENILQAVGDERVVIEGAPFRLGDLVRRAPDNRFDTLDRLLEQLRAHVPPLADAPHPPDARAGAGERAGPAGGGPTGAPGRGLDRP